MRLLADACLDASGVIEELRRAPERGDDPLDLAEAVVRFRELRPLGEQIVDAVGDEVRARELGLALNDIDSLIRLLMREMGYVYELLLDYAEDGSAR